MTQDDIVDTAASLVEQNVEPQSMQEVFEHAAGGQLPDKSPFPSMTDEEYQQLVMKQFQVELNKMVSDKLRRSRATKKKKPTKKQLKAKRKQSRRKGNRNK